MFSPELMSLVRQEQIKDQLRELKHQNLIKIATAAHQQDDEELPIIAVNWLGRQMVKWGVKLQPHHSREFWASGSSEAKRRHDADFFKNWMAQHGIAYHGVAPDETLLACKDIETVIGLQAGVLVELVAEMFPVAVRMGGVADDED